MRLLFLYLVTWLPPCVAFAESITGSDWKVHFNLPDHSALSSTAKENEYSIRNGLVACINALQTNDMAMLATYTLSGSNVITGGAGPILNAAGSALGRGATVKFVVDANINLTTRFGSNTLSGLASRTNNPLILTQDDATNGIMHNKLGVFNYGGTQQCVFVASWNFTTAASVDQWNIALELYSSNLYTAYSNEFTELLAGRFHDHTNKSHAHDHSTFTLRDSWGTNFVRFAPYPSSTNNALIDIVNVIAGAQDEIVFALNKITRMQVATSLVAAANRGVTIHGAIPVSDFDGGDSATIYQFLSEATNYTSTNIVNFHLAYFDRDLVDYDDGSEPDLIHAKYMVIDPFGQYPILIHGSANWSDSALASTSANDENTLILRHRDLARMFYAHFKKITGTFTNSPDFWLDAEPVSNSTAITFWMTDTNFYSIETGSSITGSWDSLQETVTGQIGNVTFTDPLTNSIRFYRAYKEY